MRGDVYDLNEADDVGYEGGGTINIPIVSKIAWPFVASCGLPVDDPGFIDYNFLVREAGVSNPQPDFNNPDEVRANLKKKADVNTEETWSARAGTYATRGDMAGWHTVLLLPG